MTEAKDALEIREGISGVYHYHLARGGKPLCGKLAGMTMPTKLRLSAWGTRSHLRESYCGECSRLEAPAPEGKP